MAENDLPISSDTTPHRTFLQNLGFHFVDFFQTLVVFGAIFSAIYLFVAQPHKVSGNSMLPTFHNGDYILTDKLSYRFGQPKRGDVIVLKNPRDESQDFIKRIIGTTGDSVMVNSGRVYTNGQLQIENFLPPGVYTNTGNFLSESQAAKIDDGQFIVMGDNREHSSDSREWGFVKTSEIIGKVFLRYWPPQAFGLYHDPKY